MPHKMHSYYLRNMYQKNLLRQPGALTLGGQPIDLTKVKTPVFIQASKEDHIAPFKSVFKNTKLFGGPTELMLAGSGHIAGVINHPDAKKYQHWTNKKKKKYDTAEDWFADATEHPGSWWPYWDKVAVEEIRPQGAGGAIRRRASSKPIEDAPGKLCEDQSQALQRRKRRRQRLAASHPLGSYFTPQLFGQEEEAVRLFHRHMAFIAEDHIL